MPIPALLLPSIITGGANLVGQGINALSQIGVNKKTREWNEKMYGVQRKDYLSDYNMQNLYNSPIEQMKRLKGAGLNPNLVYGTGAVANSSSPVKSASVEGWNPKAPEFDLGGAAAQSINMYYQTQLQKAQIDQLTAQTEVAHEQKWKTIAETLNVHQNTKSSEFDLGVREHLRDTTILAVEKGVEKTGLEIQEIKSKIGLLETETQVKKVLMQPSIDKMMAEILNIKKDTLLKQSNIGLQTKMGQKITQEIEEIKAKINLLKKEGALKNFELQLKEYRGRASDWPGWMKVINDIASDILDLF